MLRLCVVMNPYNTFCCEEINLCHTVSREKIKMRVLSAINPKNKLYKTQGKHKGLIDRVKSCNEDFIERRYLLSCSKFRTRIFDNT